MSKRYHQRINNNVKVTSLAQSRAKINVAWLAALAAFIFYFFSFFFSNTGWRAPAKH